MKPLIAQSLKYSVVGLLNTALTFVVMWLVLKFCFGVSGEEKANGWQQSASNALGFGAGFITSYALNRKWTFRSTGRWINGFVKFVAGAMICYIPQLILVNLLNVKSWIQPFSFSILEMDFTVSSSHICNLAGMVFYTVLNFFYNKYYTFKK
jgi:putative flippase GtrA